MVIGPTTDLGEGRLGNLGSCLHSVLPSLLYSTPAPHTHTLLPHSPLLPLPLLFSSLLPFLSSGSTKLMSSKSQRCAPERPQVFLQPFGDSSTPSRLQPFPRLRGPDPCWKGQLYPHTSSHGFSFISLTFSSSVCGVGACKDSEPTQDNCAQLPLLLPSLGLGDPSSILTRHLPPALLDDRA